MLKDLAAELLKVNKELDKTKDGAGSGKKRGAKELETGALTTILDSLSRSLDLVKTMMEKLGLKEGERIESGMVSRGIPIPQTHGSGNPPRWKEGQ